MVALLHITAQPHSLGFILLTVCLPSWGFLSSRSSMLGSQWLVAPAGV